jgi:transcriptional regulator with XRE-family HTH domain
MEGLRFIPKLIRTLRQEKSWSLDELASHSGVSPSLVFRLESGKAKPRWDTLLAVMESLEMPLWKALLHEHQEKAIPEVGDVILDRYRSGLWEPELGRPDLDGTALENLADFVLRKLDREKKGEPSSDLELPNMRDPSRNWKNGWDPAEVAQLVEVITSHIPPGAFNSMLDLLAASKEFVTKVDKHSKAMRNPELGDDVGEQSVQGMRTPPWLGGRKRKR